MMLPGARYWNTRLDVVKNCLEARLGQNSRHTYMSVVGSHVTCSIVTTRRSQSLLFGTGWLYIITHTIKFMRPEQRPLLRPWSLQGLKLCVFWHKVCSWLCQVCSWLCWRVLCEVAKCLEIVEKLNRFALLNFKIFWGQCPQTSILERGYGAPPQTPLPRHIVPLCV